MNDTPGAVLPIDIELDTSGRRLRFAWADGHKSDYDWEYLRWRCPCAYCSGEGEFPGVLKTKTSMTPEEIEMIDIELVGRYAVRPTWRDNHDTGIFTFRALRGFAEQEGFLKQA